MYNHNKAQQSKNRVHISWDILYEVQLIEAETNGRHFADDSFKCIFLNENVWIQIEISLTFVPKGPINNILALVQIMAWRRPGDKPLSEPMTVSLPTHICVTQPQWIDIIKKFNKLRKIPPCNVLITSDRKWIYKVVTPPIEDNKTNMDRTFVA